MTQTSNAQKTYEDALLWSLHCEASEHMNKCKPHTHTYRGWYNVYAITNGLHSFTEVKEHMAALCNGYAYNVRKRIYKNVLDRLNTPRTEEE